MPMQLKSQGQNASFMLLLVKKRVIYVFESFFINLSLYNKLSKK